jgi:hypothetical protein
MILNPGWFRNVEGVIKECQERKKSTDRTRNDDQGKEGPHVCTLESLKGCCKLITIQIGCIVSPHFEILILIGACKETEDFLIRKEGFHGEYRPCAHSCK